MIKRMVLLLAAWAGCFGPSLLFAADFRAQHALDYVCDYYMLDCSVLAPPNVVFVDSLGVFGFQFYGMFTLGAKDTVFLDWNTQRDPRLLMQALVHETAHYVDFNLVYRSATACEREAMAFQVMNVWAQDQGTSQDLDWYVRYDCPAGTRVAL